MSSTPVDAAPRGLTADEQTSLLALLLRGASPAAACPQLGVTLGTFQRTWLEDEVFRARVSEVRDVLSQNVAAALYRSAMEGNVSAQTLWLKIWPPRGWSNGNDEGPQATEPTFFSDLSDDELVELARAMGVDIPPEIARAVAAERGPAIAGRISPGGEDRGG